MNTIDSPNRLLLFNSVKAYDLFKNYNGIQNWNLTRKIYGHAGSLIDRSGVIKTPFSTETLPWMKIPSLNLNFNRTLKECCIEHAREILNFAKENNKEIVLLYSGGIDSTCTVVSFLLEANNEEKKLITILLNRDSILENLEFYKNHISGKIKSKDSNTWENYIRDDIIFVTGEGGDQLFSNGFTRATDFIFSDIGWDKMKAPPSPDLIIKIFEMVSKDLESAKVGWDILIDPLIKSSIVPINTIGQSLWYFHFTCKWQNVYLRILNNLIDSSNINENYIKNNFKMFYQSQNIQQWILHNNERYVCVDKFKDIKKPLKEIIFEYDKNRIFFENKTKIPSLGKLCRLRPSIGFITNQWEFVDCVDPEKYYYPNNSFI